PKEGDAMPIRRSPNGAGHTRPQLGRDRSKQVVAINRNARSQSIGISGRNHPVRARMASQLQYQEADAFVAEAIAAMALNRNQALSEGPISDQAYFCAGYLMNMRNPQTYDVAKRHWLSAYEELVNRVITDYGYGMRGFDGPPEAHREQFERT